jgi:hypothetical protein
VGVEFNDARMRIEKGQTAKGMLGGMAAHRCIEAAGANSKVPESSGAARLSSVTMLRLVADPAIGTAPESP